MIIFTIMCSKDPGYIKRPGELNPTNTEVYVSLFEEFQCFSFTPKNSIVNEKIKDHIKGCCLSKKVLCFLSFQRTLKKVWVRCICIKALAV